MSSQDQQQQQNPLPTTTPTSSAEASTQLKSQLSSLFSFFSKVSTDIATSSANLTNKNPITLIEAKRKQKTAPTPKPVTPTTTNANAKPITPVTTKPVTPTPNTNTTADNVAVAPVEKVEKAEKVEKPKSKQKSQRSTPALKEGIIHIDPPVQKKADPPAPSYNTLGDLFGSLAKFASLTVTNIQTGSSKAYDKVQGGLDLNNKIKNGLKLGKKEEKPEKTEQTEQNDNSFNNKTAEARKRALDSASRKRLEEARRMKENFEKQLRSLNEEINYLEKKDDSNMEEGSHRNRVEKKSFRISSQKSGRDHSEKSLVESKPNLPKPGAKKVLGPLEDAKYPGKKWQEGEKVMKTVQSQPLYLRMEKEFQQNVVFAELEARKEKLKKQREFYKPMDDKELREHALKYEETRKAFAVQSETGKDTKSVPLNFAKSQTYKKTLEMEKEEKVRKEQKAEEKKQLKDKQQQYAKLVKEMFFPKADPKDDLLSKENLQEIIARSQKAELPSVGYTSIAKDTNNTTNMGVRIPLRKKRPSQDVAQQAATQYSPEREPASYTYHKKEYLRKNRNPKANLVAQPVLEEHVFDLPSNRGETSDIEDTEVKPQKKYQTKGKPRMTSMSPNRKASDKTDHQQQQEDVVVEPEAPKKSYPNYLAEIRKKRIEHEEKNGGKKYGQWEKIMKKKGLSQQEKVANIMDDINRLEFKAKLKEDKIRLHNPQREVEPIELEDEVGEMYLESIKAKLAIIKDLS